MSQIKTIYDDLVISNNVPYNLKVGEEWVFEEFYDMHIPSVKYVRLNNSQIYYRFVLVNFLILDQYCSSQKVSIRDKIMTFPKFFFYKKKPINSAISLVTKFGTNYHHFVLEVIPLIILAKNHIKGDIPFIFPSSYLKFSFIREYLSLLDVKYLTYNSNEFLLIKELFVFKNFSIARFHPLVVKDISNYFLVENSISNSKKKIFISRAKSNRRKILNENDLYPILFDFGYEVVFLEELSVVSQIELFRNSYIVIGMHGAGLTNILYMNPGSIVGELRSFSDEVHIYNGFYSLSNICRLKYFYLINKGDSKKNKYSNSFVSIPEFISFLNEIESI